MIEETLLEAEEKMEKAVAVLREELSSIRTGRANAGMFNNIPVEYYGSTTPLQQLGSLQIPEARTVLIQPYDRGATNEIIKALRESDLGVNPTDDGNVIRVALPVLTEERRRDYVKLARTRGEDSRISIRAVRRKAKETLDKIAKDGDAGQDEVDSAQKDLESLTKKHVEQVDGVLEAKEKELLEV